jgi:hypothetical protein
MGEAATEPMYVDAQGRMFLVPVINMKEDGTLVLPPDVLKALHVRGAETFTFEVDEEQGAVILYAVGPDEYVDDPDFIERMREAEDDRKAGRLREMSEEDLRRLAEVD